jgi:hypothetical protein
MRCETPLVRRRGPGHDGFGRSYVNLSADWYYTRTGFQQNDRYPSARSETSDPLLAFTERLLNSVT